VVSLPSSAGLTKSSLRDCSPCTRHVRRTGHHAKPDTHCFEVGGRLCPTLHTITLRRWDFRGPLKGVNKNREELLGLEYTGGSLGRRWKTQAEVTTAVNQNRPVVNDPTVARDVDRAVIRQRPESTILMKKGAGTTARSHGGKGGARLPVVLAAAAAVRGPKLTRGPVGLGVLAAVRRLGLWLAFFYTVRPPSNSRSSFFLGKFSGIRHRGFETLHLGPLVTAQVIFDVTTNAPKPSVAGEIRTTTMV